MKQEPIGKFLFQPTMVVVEEQTVCVGAARGSLCFNVHAGGIYVEQRVSHRLDMGMVLGLQGLGLRHLEG